MLFLRAFVAALSGCAPFLSSLNGTHSCPLMKRERTAETSLLECRTWCCSQGALCNAYVWHTEATQCWVTPSVVDRRACATGRFSAWIGETRYAGPPTPPPTPAPKRYDWNLQPGLVPPRGRAWRGATVDARFDGIPGNQDNQVQAFEAAYDTRLHIYRTFKTSSWAAISPGEKRFIDAGGILFYSIEPTNWSAWTDWHSAWKIKKFAAAIKAVAPAQVMIAPGFEADGHASESQNKTALVYGTAASYKAMFRNFRKVFTQENVTNAVFVLDLSCGLRDWAFVLELLYPGDSYVDWAFVNLFQSKPQKAVAKLPKHTEGNCTAMLDELYAILANGRVIRNASIPFGLGAWGTMNATFGDPKDGYPSQPIPTADRALCIKQVAAALEDRAQYPRLAASIYFDSLNSLISPLQNTSYGSQELAPVLRNLLELPLFDIMNATTTSTTSSAS